MGYASICRELNESKVIKNDKETKWFPTSIQYILTNEKYIGDSLWQKCRIEKSEIKESLRSFIIQKHMSRSYQEKILKPYKKS